MEQKQKGLFYNERAADEEVIKSLLREISKLKGENSMPKIIQSTDGTLYLVHQFEEIDASRASELLTDLQADVQVLQTAAAAPTDTTAAPVNDGSTAAPTDGSADASAPAGVATDAPADAPAAPAAPADPTPAAPVDDTVQAPAGLPADPAPAATDASATDAPAAPALQ